MWIADTWKDYEIIDTSSGEKLERWKDYILLRPDPQVIWNTEKRASEWKRINAHYHRSNKGGGSWEIFDLPKQWDLKYELQSISNDEGRSKKEIVFNIKAFNFKHTGLFPEQAVNWEWFSRIICNNKKRFEENSDENIKVLNLFAYTGGATVAAAKAGAHVTHVDSSKGVIGWAKENAKSSNVDEKKTRWIVDDCKKFVQREIRRNNKYDAIIMDPPSYGRGPGGEIWKMEDNVFELMKLCVELLKEDAIFFLINSYTTGLQPAVLKYMMDEVITKKMGGCVEADEIGLPVRESGLILPCGASGRWYRSPA